jgi:polysaccharide pyruvyl transferase WcaK-like protein
MISALATATPVVVLGWSHKYAEVMDSFGLHDWVLPYSVLGKRGLAARVSRAFAQRQVITSQIDDHLDGIRLQSRASLNALARAIR